MRASHLAVLFGVALVTSGLRAEDSLLRDLSAEQATAFQAGTPAPGSLRVSAWVDRHDLTYARGDAVRIFVKGRLRDHRQRRPLGQGDPALSQRLPAKQQGRGKSRTRGPVRQWRLAHQCERPSRRRADQGVRIK